MFLSLFLFRQFCRAQGELQFGQRVFSESPYLRTYCIYSAPLELERCGTWVMKIKNDQKRGLKKKKKKGHHFGSGVVHPVRPSLMSDTGGCFGGHVALIWDLLS